MVVVIGGRCVQYSGYGWEGGVVWWSYHNLKVGGREVWDTIIL